MTKNSSKGKNLSLFLNSNGISMKELKILTWVIILLALFYSTNVTIIMQNWLSFYFSLKKKQKFISNKIFSCNWNRQVSLDITFINKKYFFKYWYWILFTIFIVFIDTKTRKRGKNWLFLLFFPKIWGIKKHFQAN